MKVQFPNKDFFVAKKMYKILYYLPVLIDSERAGLVCRRQCAKKLLSTETGVHRPQLKFTELPLISHVFRGVQCPRRGERHVGRVVRRRG